MLYGPPIQRWAEKHRKSIMIQQTKIRIVILGSNSRLYDIEKISRHRLALFKIISVDTVHHLPSMDGDDWGYTCGALRQIVVNNSLNSDFTVAITGDRLDDNYYIQRLGDRACVMSYFMLTDVIQGNGNTIENFILRNIYELEAIYRQHEGSLVDGDRSFVHDDTRGCLFDMNGWKENIVFSMHRPILCHECAARLKSKSLPTRYVDVLTSEINKIRKPMYHQILDLIKAHPWKAFFLASVWGLVLNISASYIYDEFKSLFTSGSSAQQQHSSDGAAHRR
jgi:hypothetical protein